MSRVKKHPHAGITHAPRRDFIKLVSSLAHGRSHGDVFGDFVTMAYCAIAKTTHAPGSDRAEDLEARYKRIVESRPPEYVRKMPELLGLLQVGIFDGCDFLGTAAGELGALNEHMGQFFTPFELSLAMARMTLDPDDVAEIVARTGFVSVHEPACGAGGMLLAMAQVVEEYGFDASLCLYAQATDLSATAYQMAYVQLACRGIPADVINGNTLTLEQFESAVTPARFAFNRYHATQRALRVVQSSASLVRSSSPQLNLFGDL